MLSAEEMKELRRLVLTLDDLEYALTLGRHVLEEQLFADKGEGIDIQVNKAIQIAMIVSYCRPFLSNRGQDAAKKSCVDWSRLDSSFKLVHDDLISFRNQEVAHSDARVRNLTVKKSNGLVRPLSRPVLFFGEDKFPEIIALIEKVKGQFCERWLELQDKMPDDDGP